MDVYVVRITFKNVIMQSVSINNTLFQDCKICFYVERTNKYWNTHSYVLCGESNEDVELIL